MQFSISMGAGDDLMSMWSGFTDSGQIPGMSDGPHVTGMVSGQVTLEPGETKEVTIVLGWYFPDRDFLGIPVGMPLNELKIAWLVPVSIVFMYMVN